MHSNYTRRDWLKNAAMLATGAALTRGSPLGAFAASPSGYHPALSVQAYIWIQHLEQEKKTFAEGVEDMLATFHRAGYRNVDLTDGFLGPDLREKTLGFLSKYSLEMPTFYASSTLHEPEAAERSIRAILELARATKPAGVRGIVTNPSPKANQELKSDVELALQAQNLNRLGAELQVLGVRLWSITIRPSCSTMDASGGISSSIPIPSSWAAAWTFTGPTVAGRNRWPSFARSATGWSACTFGIRGTAFGWKTWPTATWIITRLPTT
jgi:hypothetical protein